jgi:hypothetical protein
MPSDPRDEVLRRRALRDVSLKNRAGYHGEKRKPDSTGNIPLPTEASPWQKFADELEVTKS